MMRLVTILALGAVFLGAGDARASRSGPLTGRAGDPPSYANCTGSGCHGSSTSTLSPVGLNVPTRYVPGRQISFTVSIAAPQHADANGFEVVAKSGNSIVGTLANNGDGLTQVVSGYGMHNLSGSGYSTWTMKWTPPNAGTGTVTFYAAGNASNNSFSPDAGDRISLATAAIVENLVPAAPVLSSPADGGLALTAPPSLQAGGATDGNGDALAYRFKISASPSCEPALQTSPLVAPVSGTAAWQPSTSLTENAQYYWCAQANDGYVDGPWSAVRSFWLDAVSEDPGAVAFAYPLTDATLEPGSATFVVTAATDPDPGDVLVYDFILATDAAFAAVVEAASGVAASGGQAPWTPATALVEGVTYYVLAQARDLDGNLGAPAVTRFLAHHNDAPVAPSRNAPADGGVVTTSTVVLSANLAADAQNDVLTYRFQLCADAACAAVVEASPAVATAPAAATVTWATAATVENGRRWWRARAHDGYVFGPYMAAASFAVNAVTEAPPAPVVLSPPSDGFSFTSLTPVIQVANASDPDPGSAPPVYDVYVYSDAARTSLVASAAGLRDAGAATAWTVSPALADVTPYYLTVRARDAEGNTAATQRSFVTDTLNTAPGAPSSLAPNNVVVPTAQPRLTAAPAADGEGDTLSYYVSLDTAPTFAGVAAQFSPALTWPAWTPPVALQERLYFWRVRAFDGGLYGAPADATFTVNAVNDPPGAPVPILPLDGGVVNTRAPVLRADAASDPENSPLVYLFELSLDASFTVVYRQSPPVAPSGGAAAWSPETALDDDTAYFWRVRARDAADASVFGPYAGAFSFAVVNGNLPPAAPEANDAEQPAAAPVALLAEGATDPDGDAVTLAYEIYLDSNLTILLASAENVAPGAAWEPPDVDFTRGAYHWRARATDGRAVGPWSGTAKLTLTVDALPFETGYELPGERVTGKRVREIPAAGGCRASSGALLWWLAIPLALLRRRRLAATAAGACLVLAACGDGGTTTVEEDIVEPAVYGRAEAQAIFDGSCIGCHSGEEPAAGLALDAEHAFKALVGVAPQNAVAADRGMKLVDPGQPENSFLLYKVTEPGLGEGERMPIKLPKLSDEQVEILRRWIDDGAKP